MERKEKIMGVPTPTPTPSGTPWEDYVPSYIEDNAKGYRKYVDKLAQYLNSNSGGGGEGLKVIPITMEPTETDFSFDTIDENTLTEISNLVSTNTPHILHAHYTSTDYSQNPDYDFLFSFFGTKPTPYAPAPTGWRYDPAYNNNMLGTIVINMVTGEVAYD